MTMDNALNRRKLLTGGPAMLAGMTTPFDWTSESKDDISLSEKIAHLENFVDPAEQLRVLKQIRDLLYKKKVELSDQILFFKKISALLHPYLQTTLSFRQFITKKNPNLPGHSKSGLEYFYIPKSNERLLVWVEFIAKSIQDKTQALALARNLETIAPQILNYSPNQLKDLGRLALVVNLVGKIQAITQKYREEFLKHRMHSFDLRLVFAGTPDFPQEPDPKKTEHRFLRKATLDHLDLMQTPTKKFVIEQDPKIPHWQERASFLETIATSKGDLEIVLLGHNNLAKKTSGGIFISPSLSISTQDLLNSYKTKLNQKGAVKKTGLIYFHPCDKIYMRKFMEGWSNDSVLCKFAPPIVISECEEGTQSYTYRERLFGSEILEHFLRSDTIGEFITDEKKMRRFYLESRPCVHVPFFDQKNSRWTYLQIF